MNYSHAYHAGALADIFKHVLLILTIQYYAKKPKPFTYLDTHAGAGLYPLRSKEALASQEAAHGILKYWDIFTKTPALKAYTAVIKAFNPTSPLVWYPGSPIIAKQLLSSQDNLMAWEKNPPVHQALTQHLPNAKLGDGFAGLKAAIPTRDHRAFIHIDPPFEDKTDWEAMVAAISLITKRMPHAVILLWLPIKTRLRATQFLTHLKTLSISDVLLWQWKYRVPPPQGLCGGMSVLINAPWEIEAELAQINGALNQIMSSLIIAEWSWWVARR